MSAASKPHSHLHPGMFPGVSPDGEGPKSKRVIPLPGAVNPGKPWKVVDGPPVTNVKLRIMSVPLEEEDENTKTHEMIHARFDKPWRKSMGVSETSYKAAAEIRVSVLGRRGQLPGFEHEGDLFEPSVKEYLEIRSRDGMSPLKPYEQAILMAIGACGEPSNLDTFPSSIVRNTASEAIRAILHGYRVSCRCSECMAGNRPAYGHVPQIRLRMAAKILDKLSDMEGSLVRGAPPVMTRRSGMCRWGDMLIRDSSRKKRITAKALAPSRYYREYGVKPTGLYRYCSDRAVFECKVSQPNVALLIDASGSMWGQLGGSPSRFQEWMANLLREVPASIVATYAGMGYQPLGVLNIIAKDGMMVETSSQMVPTYDNKRLGENVIDYPALEWLSQQAGSKFWISDGHVTMYSEGGGCEIDADINGKPIRVVCEEFCEQNGIKRIEHIAEMNKVVRTLKGGY